MELNFGGGSFDCLLDVTTGEFWPYAGENSAAEIHKKWGGSNYYLSRSGLSGAGFIPRRLEVRKVSTYRVDSYHIEAPQNFASTIGELELIVPINYGEKRIDYNFPVVLRKKGEETLRLLSFSGEVASVLKAESSAFAWEEREITVGAIIRPSGELENFRFLVERPANLDCPKWQWATRTIVQVVEAFHHKYLKFVRSEQEYDSGQNPGYLNDSFWGRLGLFPNNYGEVFKFSGNLCRGKYRMSDLDDAEKLQALAPKNVRVLSPNFYLQESGDQFFAVANTTLSERITDQILGLTEVEAVQVLSGDWEKFYNRCREAAEKEYSEQISA